MSKTFRAINYHPQSGTFTVKPTAIRKLFENNCAIPDIDRVIFNLKNDNITHPTLTTIVFFTDGTKTVVQNSINDPVILETVTLSDGSTVKTADHSSKERGVVYAIVKRILSRIDDSGNTLESGFGGFLNKVIKNSTDNIIKSAEAQVSKKVSKANHANMMANAKPKVKRYSIAETLTRFNAILDEYEATQRGTECTCDSTRTANCCGTED